jgi:hypothetical protein
MSNLTFIIPVRIDSNERYGNILTTVLYLLKHTDGKLIITENAAVKKLNFENIPRVTYRFQHNSSPIFHRTKILNEMLNIVDTPITVNYDADVLLPPASYKKAEDCILKDNADVIYPFKFEQYDQIKIFHNDENYKKFKQSLDLNDIIPTKDNTGKTISGHCQFVNTNTYKKIFMENENFIDWGPEDTERLYRFQMFKCKVGFLDAKVYHQEHPPSIRSNCSENNRKLFDYLTSLSTEDYKRYYQEQEYWKKYETAVYN